MAPLRPLRQGGTVICGTQTHPAEGNCGLIDTCGPGGGYIFSMGISVNTVDPANLQAIIETAKESEVCRK